MRDLQSTPSSLLPHFHIRFPRRRPGLGRAQSSLTARKSKEARVAYYKVWIEVWCDWDPEECDLEEIAQNISAGEAVCTKRAVLP